MFELINRPSPPRLKQITTLTLSVAAHAALVALAVVLPFLYITDQLPEPPDMLAFIAASPTPPPPPPPPAAPRQAQPVKPKVVPKDTPKPTVAVPIEAPAKIEPERLPEVPVQEFVPGGMEGGTPGGFEGGIAGSLPVMPALPPPVQPVRIGGDIKAPTLLHRVNPEYPLIAVSAKKTGVVILEATVDAEGIVREVRVLRSEPLLDNAAIEAVKQWRYSPLRLNGQTYPFILTVTLNFSIQHQN